METPYIILTTLIEKDGGQYASVCPELGVASCGDSIQEASDSLEEAVELYLNHLEDAETRHQVFLGKSIELRWQD